MKKLVNIANMAASIINETPYRHSIIDGLLNRETVQALIADVPDEMFTHTSRDEGSDKTYKVFNNIIYSLEEQKAGASLPSIWMNLIAELTTIEYRNAVSRIAGFDVTNTFIEMTLKKYQLDDYISAHTDRDAVPVTHVIFLNELWKKEWGGEFCIHDSQVNIVDEILPLWSNSVLFRQSENSWHSVNPCKAPDATRYGLQVAFWLNQEKLKLPGRYE